MDKEIVMYSRSYGCPFVRIARRVLDRHKIPYREILINQDSFAKQRVIEWTGFESVPTIVIALRGKDTPYQLPAKLPAGSSPRGINRGTMITEPSKRQLEDWLRQHDFLD